MRFLFQIIITIGIIFGVIFGIVFGLVIYLNLIDSPALERNQDDEQKTTKINSSDSGKTLERKIGDLTDYDAEIKYEQGEFGKMLIVLLHSRSTYSILSDSDSIVLFNMQIGGIMSTIYTNSDYDDIDIVSVGITEKFKDNYGVINEEVSYAVSLSRETASKINWSGFMGGNSNRLPYNSIANPSNGDMVYLHPSFNVSQILNDS